MSFYFEYIYNIFEITENIYIFVLQRIEIAKTIDYWWETGLCTEVQTTFQFLYQPYLDHYPKKKFMFPICRASVSFRLRQAC